MKEGMLSRVSRLISASANALIDGIEGAAPELVMKEAMREIDGVIGEVKHQMGKLEAQKHHSAKTLADENSLHSELSQQIETAVKQNRDDLAKVAIEKQLDIEAQIPVLEAAIAEATDEMSELDNYVSALEAKKREMQAKLKEVQKLARSRDEVAVDGSVSANATSPKEREHAATSAFNRILNSEGVHTNESSADAGKLEELKQLSRASSVEARLAQLKSEKVDA